MFTISKTSWILLAVLAIGTSRILFAEDATIRNGPCKANGIEGVCVFIAKCAQALQLLRLGDYDTARNMLCGFDKSDVLVCCPAEKNEDRITFMNKTDDPITAATTTSKPVAEDAVESINEVPLTPAPRPQTHPPQPPQSIPRTTRPPTTRRTTEIPRSTTARPFTTEEYPKDSNGLPDRTVCGLDSGRDRIYGGTIVLPEEFAWLARLAVKRGNVKEITFPCAGSLITNRYVLTAAHCVNNTGIEVIGVRLGEWDAESDQDCYRDVCTDPPVDVEVDQIIIHPAFMRRYALNDIALLRLKTEVNFTDFIRPVCLPTTSYVARQDYTSDSIYQTAGWGLTEYGTTSQVKRKVSIKAVPLDICKVALPVLPDNLNNSIICAGGKDGQDSCRGDSGGPLVKQVSEEFKLNWFIYGITSSGSKICGTQTKPGVYTRVSRYLPWILENIKT